MNEKNIVITGATDGIGLAAAKTIASVGKGRHVTSRVAIALLNVRRLEPPAASWEIRATSWPPTARLDVTAVGRRGEAFRGTQTGCYARCVGGRRNERVEECGVRIVSRVTSRIM